MIHVFEIVLTSCLLGTSVNAIADSKDWIGRWTIDAELSNRDFVVGRPVTYTIIITGTGQRGPAPTLTDNPRFAELFDIVGPLASQGGEGDRIRDRYEFQLAPKSATIRRVPPFRWAYTNERTNQKETLLVEGMDINVKDRATIDAGEPFDAEQRPASTWIFVILLMVIALLAVVLLARRTGHDKPVSAKDEGHGDWEVRARACLAWWRGSRSPDDIDVDLRAFQSCVAERLGLDPSVSDAGEIKASVGSRVSAARGHELCRLLDEIDAFRFAGEGDIEALKERALAWLENELREPGYRRPLNDMDLPDSATA